MTTGLFISKMKRQEFEKLNCFTLNYGIADTKFGRCLIAVNDNRLVYVTFSDGKRSILDHLKQTFPKAIFNQNNELISTLTADMFDDTDKPINVLLIGTDFQLLVWEELLNIKKGATVSYEDIAKAIGRPKAIRAVANAIAKNNVAYLIPCHRVIPKTGGIGNYGGGADKKMKMLKYEHAVV